MNRILIFGAGGHAKVINYIANSSGKYIVEAFVSNSKNPTSFCGIQHIGFDNLQEINVRKGIVAIGDNFTRAKVVNDIIQLFPDFEFINLIHPSAVIAPDVSFGVGNCVMPNAVINSSTRIGSHAIVNSSSVVEHDCSIHDYSSIAPGSILGGNAIIGTMTAISIGVKVNNGIKIGDNTVIGSGSVVVKNIDSNAIAFGVPCKIIRTREKNEPYL